MAEVNGGDALGIVYAALSPPALALMAPLVARAMHARPRPEDFYRQWAICGAGTIVAEIVNGSIIQLAVASASTFLAVVLWWLSRRKKDRAARLIGDKSRALLAAVVARMRETAKPRRVLRPVPGGAS